jgi:TRAP-type uncharacterized transport system substrate-binding protein
MLLVQIERDIAFTGEASALFWKRFLTNPIRRAGLPGAVQAGFAHFRRIGAKKNGGKMAFIRNAARALLVAAFMSGASAAVGQVADTTPSRYQDEKRSANSSTVSIISSSISSSYTEFAQDIQNVLDEDGQGSLRVLPILGSGGGQNIHDMLFLKGIDMGVTDAAYLGYWKRKDPVLYGDIENRIAYICKLLNAEFHILVSKDIKSFDDLRGKKVNFWKRLSITSLAAETIFDALGVKVQPTFLENKSAIEKLRSGEIAAVARMSGAPHGDYDDIKPGDGFHLLPLDPATLPAGRFGTLMSSYLPAELTAEQYPQLIPAGEKVPTVATIIVLAAYNWPEKSERYGKMANFVQRFFDNLEQFRQPTRHPKWSDVNPAANVSGWRRFKPAQDWLDQNMAATNSVQQKPNDLRTAFEAFMQDYTVKTGLGPQDKGERERMYNEFSKWWHSRQNVPQR